MCVGSGVEEGGLPVVICQAGRSVNKGHVGGASRTSRLDRVLVVTFYTDTAVPQNRSSSEHVSYVIAQYLDQ